jgi:nitrate/nitrite-specific signal transduction histidine kinase
LFSGEDINLGSLWYHLSPAVVSSVVLLPLVLFLAIRFSHRFVGPMVRFQRTVKQLAGGETVAPITLRRNDFWGEFANDLNQLSGKISELSTREPEREDTLIEC